MKQKKIEDLTDIELAEEMRSNYQTLMQTDLNLKTINAEIERRKGKNETKRNTSSN